MNREAEQYTVKQVGLMAGVSVRTLHHYDAIGLLRPARVAGNGYRVYGREELLRLQEILLLRDLGMGLREIADMLALDAGDRVERMAAYRTRFAEDLSRRHDLLRTIDRTLVQLKGETPMDVERLYEGIAPETQAQYEAWLEDRYGDCAKDILERSRTRVEQGSGGKLRLPDGRMDELARLEGALVEAYETGAAPGAESLAPLLEAHRGWVARQWKRPCGPEAYAGLADLYLAHPDFVARYERLSEGFSAFLPEAMKAYAGEAA